MGKNSKRSKSYYINSSKRRKIDHELRSNMTGFLCTCNMKEKECLKEAYNLLNEFANILYGEEEAVKKVTQSESDSVTSEPQSQKRPHQEKDDINDSESEEEDIECALKGEVEALQKSTQLDKSERRFQQVSARVNNCIFISTTLPDPVELTVAIMDDILTQQKTRTQHLVRMIPVQKTCKAFMEDIERTAEELVLERFPKCKTSFYIAFKTRNNNSIQRDAVLKSLSNIISNYNTEALADYKIPDLVLNVDILKNVCCLGLLPHYLTKYCKYNLLKLIQSKEDESEDKVNDGTAIPGDQTKDGED